MYFQNAVRLALGLAAARLAADLLDLTHGFWVLLATLSLMRTSAIASGLALIPAFLGTLGGALVAAGVLAVIGDDTIVYAVVLPIAMVITFAAGPLLGPARGPVRLHRSSSRCCSPSWRRRRGSWPRCGSPTSSSAG